MFGMTKEAYMMKMMEEKAQHLPCKAFICAAGLAAVGSCICRMKHRRHTSDFVGMWVAPLLILGVYAKMKAKHHHGKCHHKKMW